MVLAGWRKRWLAIAASPELKFRDRRWNRYLSNVVSGLPTARQLWSDTGISSQCQIVKKRTKYILSPNFVELATFFACNMSPKLPILNKFRVRMRRLFYYSLSKTITPCLSPCSCRAVLARQKWCRTYEYCYKYWLSIFSFWKFSFTKFFFNFFSKLFFEFSFENLKKNFFFQIFFPGLRCLAVYGNKTDTLSICNKKYMQQAIEIGLSSLVMCRVLRFGLYCSHHTQREKSNFFPFLHEYTIFLLCET